MYDSEPDDRWNDRDVKVKVEIDLKKKKKNWKALDTDYIQKTGDVTT